MWLGMINWCGCRNTEVYGEDLNLGYPKYEAQILTTTLLHSIQIGKIMV